MSTTLHLSVAEYGRMVELGAFAHLKRQVELFRGEIREMNPAGPLHNDLVMYLTEWSFKATDRDSIRVTVQTGLELAEQQSCPEPDLMWLRAGRYQDHHPTAADVKLVIEVSDSSLPTDLSEKVHLYAEAGIVELWIVDAQGKRIHVYREPEKGQYQQTKVVGLGDPLLPLEPCQTALNLRELFAP